MLERKIKFEDFNGQMQEKTFYFHLNQAELLKLMTSHGNYTLADELIEMMETNDGKKVMEVFDDLLEASYGKVSLDGLRFQKSPEIFAEFKESEAYSVLFMELVTDAKKAAEFFNGIIPKKLAEQVAEAMKDPNKLPDKYKGYSVAQNA